MEKEKSEIRKIHVAAGQEKIERLKQKIAATQNNVEISEEIITETSSNAQREKLLGKNTRREHAIGSMNKQIRDIEQTISERDREAAT